MEARLLRRPVSQCGRSSTWGTGPLVLRPSAQTATLQQRTKATSSRHRRALNVRPHPSFVAPSARGGVDRIVFNPPASEPSVYHTPFKFLPKSDPRRRANLPSLFASSTTISYSRTSSSSSSSSSPSSSPSDSSAAASSSADPDLPPVAVPNPKFGGRKSHHLTADDVAEMRRLRAADPEANSVGALARRFGCSNLFVLMCCGQPGVTPAEHSRRRAAELEAVRARWGPVRARAREDRQRRREMLLRGEI